MIESAPPETSTLLLDRAAASLAESRESWLRTPVVEKVAHLRTLMRRTVEVAPDFVAEITSAKRMSPGTEGEEWISAVVPQLRTMRILADTLEHIDRTGRAPVRSREVRVRGNGQVALRVVPASPYDRLVYLGIEGEVWLDPAIDRSELDDHLGGIYTKPTSARPGTALVLGAGNQASIAILDAVHKLFVEGKVVLLKFSEVNGYIGAYVERVFADLISAGFLRTAYGGPGVGAYLVAHDDVDEIHMTGSAATHDAIVFGTGPEALERKRRGKPLLAKPVTSELGNVSPVVVVPGVWSERDLRFQAEDVATQMLYNAGFNCNAAKVLVLPEEWPQREAFLDRLRAVLRAAPARAAYYPGANERFERFLASHDDAEILGSRLDGYLPPVLLNDLDPGTDHPVFAEETFCTISGVVRLPGGPEEYLDRAVDFCNERLAGTLNATLIIDPATRREFGDPRLGGAIERLRYGSIVVNEWASAAFAFGSTVWGAFPGHTPQDIGSGTGFVHNARLVDRPERSVITVPFRRFPKPPWFITHRSHTTALRRGAGMEGDPRWWRLPGLLLAALRS